MTDHFLDYRRIVVKGITALEQVGRFTIRVCVQVREEAHSHNAHILESEIDVSSMHIQYPDVCCFCAVYILTLP
jgi:hypothetical protein